MRGKEKVELKRPIETYKAYTTMAGIADAIEENYPSKSKILAGAYTYLDSRQMFGTQIEALRCNIAMEKILEERGWN
ncbi:MAG: hypothetical protein AMQ74_01935 [Candidatus Methanofastidiosum methylothiophilum]|uniref:Uncharacterized protein n=1 Tax=Candidatus Methanofastidiosum methylothiophilum TaxID=1705564 RepID=A0A150IIG6_9EURY|nr:MAG: hypothetical protein AMQ74_01935 [Candidatus Methanofastidiosum methylthiophilus]